MAILIGELAWLLPGVALHLYGKDKPVAARKMGHITAVADTIEEARGLAIAARDSL